MILINAQIDYIAGEKTRLVSMKADSSHRNKRILFDIFNWDSL